MAEGDPLSETEPGTASGNVPETDPASAAATDGSSPAMDPDVPPPGAAAADREMGFEAPGTFDAEEFLKNLTKRPGVYRMLGADGSVLYVGKARNLKNRVTSYFRASGLTAKTIALVSKIADIQTTATGSETEALLLEQSLIKEERPPYNIVLRDDKSYPFIHVSDHPYPRLMLHRGSKRRKGIYFGPYPSAGAVRESINILQKLFQIRSCEDGFYKNRSRPCLQHQIGRCSAPCVGTVQREQYADDVRLAVMFLEGKSADVLGEFKTNMESASGQLEFEKAAKYRDQIKQLRRIQENQYVHGAAGHVDIFGIAVEGGYACVQGHFVRDGRLLGHRTWYPKNELSGDAASLLSAFVSQYYFGGLEREIPKVVLTSEDLADAAVLADALTERSGRRVEVTAQVRTQRAQWLSMAKENAQLSLAAFVADRKNVFARFVDLQESLALEDMPRRLECFDISHSSGEATVASCVVFDTNGPLKSDYRRFNIEGIVGGDDYAAMEQALRRRYKRLKEGEAALPDILIIDGGLGQIGRAAEVLADLQVEDVVLMGIAKGPTRRPGMEAIIIHGQGEVNVTPNSAGLHLLQHIRDEAHRFAITGHRGRRQKARRKSVLDDIPGVGPKRKRELLAHFGSIGGIQGASVQEIAKVPGINRKLADEIFGALHAA